MPDGVTWLCLERIDCCETGLNLIYINKVLDNGQEKS